MSSPSKITILGCTGSIGTQTLDVVRTNSSSLEVFGLSCNSNVELVVEQAREFSPTYIAIADVEAANEVKNRVQSSITVLPGQSGVKELASIVDCDVVVGAISGFAGVVPIVGAINAGNTVALANKEVVVAAGELLRSSKLGSVIPLDSEHTGIYQCLRGAKVRPRNVVITASGGPFLHTPLQELFSVTRDEALRHPNWEMGSKITIDSATMMNKGLEVIEAAHFFDLSAEEIDVLVHPQSVVHGLVNFADGSAVASMSESDMRIPISYALGAAIGDLLDELRNSAPQLDLIAHRRLEFFAPDLEKFPCLKLAYKALRQRRSYPNVLNAANEIAVAAFLSESIGFMDISDIVDATMSAHTAVESDSVESIVAVDSWARDYASELVSKLAS
jgi:1-deoxy-D-xylulose-5-phosphate reductoisomerase